MAKNLALLSDGSVLEVSYKGVYCSTCGRHILASKFASTSMGSKLKHHLVLFHPKLKACELEGACSWVSAFTWKGNFTWMSKPENASSVPFTAHEVGEEGIWNADNTKVSEDSS